MSKLYEFIATTNAQCWIMLLSPCSPYLNGKIREVVSDCALPISVVIFSFIGSYFFLDIQRKFRPPRLKGWGKSSWEASSHAFGAKNKKGFLGFSVCCRKFKRKEKIFFGPNFKTPCDQFRTELNWQGWMEWMGRKGSLQQIPYQSLFHFSSLLLFLFSSSSV